MKTHPRFSGRATFDYDFALLQLKKPLEWSKYPGIRPVCMPTTSSYLGHGIQGWASGWGVLDPNNKKVQAKKLQTVDVHTISNRECEKFYGFSGSVTDSMLLC